MAAGERKYVRDQLATGGAANHRYFLNLMLDGLVHAKYMGPTGQQD